MNPMRQPPPFDITTSTLAGNVLAVRPSGELDLATAPRLFDVLHDARKQQRSVELDLSALTFMDSTGLSGLLEASRAAKADGWNLRIVRPSQPVSRVIEMTGLQGIITIDGDPS
jgi:anti-sigma B factor antagonist